MGPDRTRLTSDDSVIVPRPYPRANQRGTGRVKGASSSSSAKARRRWICPDCKKVLSKKDSRHINLHRPKEEQERVFCPFKGCKQWTAKGQFCNLYPHIRRDHTHETLQCPHCPFDTHDHTCMSRHWKYKHPEMVQPSWPPPKLPPKILVSSPPVDDTASVGSPSSAFSHLQLSPFSPIYSVYGTPSPSSPASSSSSVYGTPHSPMHPLPAENAVFNASCAVYPVSINSDTADVNLPGTTTTSLYPQPVDGPLLSPLSSELSLPKLDSDSLHDNYQSSSDRSSLSDADLSLGGSPYPQPLIDDDASSTISGLGLFHSNEVGVDSTANGYTSGALNIFLDPNSCCSPLDGLYTGGLTSNNFFLDASSSQGPLTYASESNSTGHWSLGEVNATFPVADFPVGLFSPLGTSKPTTFPSANYGHGLHLDRRHSAVVGGIPPVPLGSTSFLGIPTIPTAPLYFGSTSIPGIWDYTSGSGNV